MHPTVQIVRSKLADTVSIREFCTIRDSEIGDKCCVYERVSIKKSRLDSQVSINAGTFIEYASLGVDVMVGPNCSIVGVYHELGRDGAEKEDSFREIVLEENVWLGAGVIVLPGVRVGKNSVIGAGAIVTKDVPPRHILRGIPPTQSLTSLAEKFTT